ncbi:hypothetical protein HMPREF9098_0551 [Kingella denitrificans ATCC 33394]|uniref:Uncharacterized protein n=1 Tax=Kingella denitrificans ATCC 33394 TaxID=888741 RepID=F0EXG5_9NEIS|nr:hypothetical protein HMPREF9098_0551 [Kingella denitrificans ATCC 33394]
MICLSNKFYLIRVKNSFHGTVAGCAGCFRAGVAAAALFQ